MSTFKFKFESVRKVKEAFEKKAQKELAQIDFIITQHQEIKERLTNEINNLRNYAYRKKMNIAELRFIGDYKDLLRKQLDMETEVIVSLENKRKKKIEEVTTKSKEKKIMDQLENDHRESFTKEANASELKMLDEIAVQNFNKGKK